MCLHGGKKINVEEDLACYKVLKKNKITGELLSPFYNTPIVKNTKLTAQVSFYDLYCTNHTFNGHSVNAICYNEGKPDERFTVYGGAFHSFLSLDTAVKYLKELTKWSLPGLSQYVVFKCTIPKDSKVVFEGTCYIGNKEWVPDGFSSYASSELIVEKEVFVA